ncbi:hypothetical protein [Anaerotruncus rubiinfantis]|uniref:hypothetical protein n=1 Tax=Anaerotruncus rubiinfantis TaxID=1720200 RepID=UPI00189C5568|nr:hypothetical protein [Anaerotruncus rubiinfantis]
MTKQKKQEAASGWQFPKALEIIKCREGNKEFLKERANRRSSGDHYFLVAEFPLYAQVDEEKVRKTWKLAKRTARDFLRTEWVDAAIVTHTPPSKNTGRTHDCICVYAKYLLT